jgi:hypothetical protein
MRDFPTEVKEAERTGFAWAEKHPNASSDEANQAAGALYPTDKDGALYVAFINGYFSQRDASRLG